MNPTCFICDTQTGLSLRNATNLFGDDLQLNSGKTLSTVIGDIVEKKITEAGVYTRVICKKCQKAVVEYDLLQVRLQAIKEELVDLFKSTLIKHNLTYDTFSKETLTPVKKKVVLPASKLQPLPPDFLIKAGLIPMAKTVTMPVTKPVITIPLSKLKAAVTNTMSNKKTLLANQTIGPKLIMTSKLEKFPPKSDENLNSSISSNPISTTSTFTQSMLTDKVSVKSEVDVKKLKKNLSVQVNELGHTDEQAMEIEEEQHALKNNKIITNSDKSKVHECSVCNKKYSSRTLLSEHMNIHNGARPYACSVCGKTFTSKYTHQSHLKKHLVRPRPFECGQCGKSFLTAQYLTQHENTHPGIKDFVCTVCGKAFGTQHNLELHGVVHSESKPFMCETCGKAFATRPEFRNHIRIHTGERPFICDICGASFTQRSNLQTHRRGTHLDDKRHHCTLCPKRFKRRTQLKCHIQSTHTGERPLKCEICRATFVYPERYKKHLLIHSGKKPYSCEVCGRSFNSRDSRNSHRFVHSDRKQYECVVCGAGYMRKHLLYQHMNNSGHLAESIVINQPKVIKLGENTTSKAVKGGTLLDTVSADQLTDQQSGQLRLVSVSLPDGSSGWVAINQ